MDETKCTICGKDGQEFDDHELSKPNSLFYCEKCGEVVCYNCLYLTDEDDSADECSKCNGGSKRKPKAPIIDADGNIFNILGIATKTLKRAGQVDKAAELQEKILYGSGINYDGALCIIMEYVDPVKL